jgi:hypothetical protein
MLAHGGGAPETISVVLLFGGLWIGWAGWSRLKGAGFPRLPIGGAYGLLGLAVVFALAAGFVPQAIWGPTGAPAARSPAAGVVRPASTATISFTRPTHGQRVGGDQLEVVMTLSGGRIVDTASTSLTPDTGHIHLSVDGTLVSMTYGLVQILPVQVLARGRHTLLAEFVAADHGPFAPRVTASVTFVKESG